MVQSILDIFWFVVWMLSAAVLLFVLYKLWRLYRYFSDRRAKKLLNVLQIPDGDKETEVVGEQYRSELLKEIYRRVKSQTITLTVTPESSYQHQKGWPKPPFINVNLPDSTETTRNNWLGYVPKRLWDCDFEKLLREYDRVDVFGHIVKTGSEYDLILTIDSDFIDRNPI